MQSAPYLEGDNYYMAENGKSPESEKDLNNPSNEFNESVDEESLREQLNKTEEEIITLRQVLNVKLKLAHDLKRQLGITAINEMKEDIIHGLHTIKESNTFKATSVVMKNVKEKTSTTLSTASNKFSQKIGMLRNTNTFKSIEGKMGNAYTSVKKVPCKYNPGDKIFAKVKGFVYWPARVNPLPVDIVIPPNKIPIFFYGTHEVFFISPTSCWPYDEKNKAKWGKPKSRAHFNQGMDEIENHSTIYEYGADPSAEDFLAQFYEFKRSNGQNTTPNKLKSTFENDNESGVSKDDSNKEPSKTSDRKRNKSSSSISIKENKNGNNKINAMTELSVDVKSDDITEVSDLTQSITPSKKRQTSGSALSSKENTNCQVTLKNESEPNQTETGVTTRKRQASGASEMNKSEKSRSVSRKRQRSTTVKKDTNEEIKPEINEAHDREFNEEPISMDSTIKTDLFKCESLLNSVVKLENNITDSFLSKMLGKEDMEVGKSDESQFSDNSLTKKSNPKLRRSLPVSKKVEKELDSESDSLSIDSDNPEDEDFKPATKTKRLTKKVKISKPKKPINKKLPSSQPKRKSVSKTTVKRKTSKLVSDDSLSSLSSVEEWNVTVDKTKELEERTKSPQIQRLHLNDTPVKESKSKSKESNKSSDKINLENDQTKCEIQKEVTENKKEKSPIKDIKIVEENRILEFNSEVMEIDFKTMETDTKITDGKETIYQIKENQEFNSSDNNENKVNEPCQLPNEKERNIRPKKSKDNKVLDIIDLDDDIQDELVKEITGKSIESPAPQEKIKKVKINLKEMKVSKQNSKPKVQQTRKRKRKLSSSDSDVEIIKREEKPKSKKVKLYEKSSESDENSKKDKIHDKTQKDKLQILQNFNVDIRSCLMLGNEDYKKCLERFKSLCEMEIDLLSLVKVWQLMDTVKKCRRYKRNEHIKNEAQAVYKRFMEIYNQASKEEIATAQSLLAQYRHQNNVQNQNVGNASNKSNGGLVIPISVADMFQNRPFNQSEFNNNNNKHNMPDSAVTKHIPETTDPILNKNPNSDTQQKCIEEEINEDEKMRLLSIDLEAKVSDILNKIEKNVEVMNQKSLSHLLPTADENHLSIELPMKWKSVNDKSVDREKYTTVDNSDEDEDDVEAIVRRIEEVPIKLPEPEHLITNNINENSSALDARIENLFNNSFISSTTPTSTINKDARQKKSRNSSSRHHNNNNSNKNNNNNGKNTSPSRMTMPNQKLESPETIVIMDSDKETAPMGNESLGFVEIQKDDIEIYDLLGV